MTLLYMNSLTKPSAWFFYGPYGGIAKKDVLWVGLLYQMSLSSVLR